MRIFERDQIVEILSTVKEGISFAKTASLKEARPVLKDCIEAVSMIGEFLAGTLTPERAAFYAELLSGAKAGLEASANAEGGAAAGDILRKLEEAREALEAENEVKIKVAFFPYKASMWDCLESVWIAARNDLRCETVVVPIRYADRTPEGEVLKVSCERELFPDYVPVTPFEDYDPEEDRPDIAYIHNPYDGNNFITSVDPRYYSHELKKSVGTLVYVPYFVSGGKSDENMARIVCESAADVIVAQSEADAEVFSEIAPGRDVRALGSPKVDRILRYEKQKPDMPPEWRERLSGKKVFLLNTSVSTLLREGMTFNEKLSGIFRVFESRDDAALLWRPHPLSEATINSMRPELLEGYRELERRIKTGSFGVLDETADVTRAIALSDAYIGEWASSLRFMYAITGKPVYLMRFNIAEELSDREREELLRSVWIMGPITPEEGGETALCIELDTNSICRVDMKTGRLCPVMEIPGISAFDIVPYIYIADCGDKYILPPVRSDSFIELDKQLNFIRRVEIPERARGKTVFTYSLRLGKYVYSMPSRSSAIARYDTDTGEYEYFYGWHEKVCQYATEEDAGIFTEFLSVIENKVYQPSYKDNIIGELNLDTMEIKLRRVGAAGNRYGSIAFDGRYFWLTRYRTPDIGDEPRKDSIVRWDPKTGKSESFDRFPKRFEPGRMSFSRVIFCGSYLLVFPREANMILRIDPKSGKMTEFGSGIVASPENTENFLPDPKAIAFYYTGHIDGESVIGVMPRERALLKINEKTGETRKLPLRFDEAYREAERCDPRRFTPQNNGNSVFLERPLFPMGGFLEALLSGKIPPRNEMQTEFYLEKIENSDGSCGEKIHEYVMNKAFGGSLK